MISTQLEALKIMLPDAVALLKEHHSEIANFPDRMPLDPMFNEYAAAEEKNCLVLITAREDGQLVGYYVGFVRPGLHYKTTLTCLQDIFYVRPAARLKGVGEMLFSAVREELKRRGVAYWKAACKTGDKSAAGFLVKQGFQHTEEHFAIWLAKD